MGPNLKFNFLSVCLEISHFLILNSNFPCRVDCFEFHMQARKMDDREDFDLNELNDAQKQTLEQFITVTSQEHNVAIPLLRKCQWNLQVSLRCLQSIGKLF